LIARRHRLVKLYGPAVSQATRAHSLSVSANPRASRANTPNAILARETILHSFHALTVYTAYRRSAKRLQNRMNAWRQPKARFQMESSCACHTTSAISDHWGGIHAGHADHQKAVLSRGKHVDKVSELWYRLNVHTNVQTSIGNRISPHNLCLRIKPIATCSSSLAGLSE
jgi:hypothetical protein